MSSPTEVRLPDIGDFEEVDVIEVLVSVGDRIRAEDSLITLESDKATMEIPAPSSGVVKEISVGVGDRVREGSPILTLDTEDTAETPPMREVPEAEVPEPLETPSRSLQIHSAPVTEWPEPVPGAPVPSRPPVPELKPSELAAAARKPHASPGIRRLARDLGVELAQVEGSGPKARILKGDIQGFVRKVMTRSAATAPVGIPMAEMPSIDFAKFGEVEVQPLSRIRKRSGANLHRNWITAPHVTQFDETDITELESFRRAQIEKISKEGVKLTLLAFLVKASVLALKEYPEFNASLDPSGEHLVLKRYYHIGIAVDTPDGLVVPVVRNAEQKGLFQLAAELGEVGTKAREKRLTPEEMQGGTFTVSSLGGIGGTAFTPIINAPQVAILGISQAAVKPVYQDGQFVPRLILPIALSYDHRVIDGAAAARFTTIVRTVLSDIRNMLL